MNTQAFIDKAHEREVLSRFCRWLREQGVTLVEDGPVRSDHMLIMQHLGLEPKAIEQEDAALPYVEFEENE